MERTFKRGDVYYANLSPVIGSEQGGMRPVLIISNDIGNRFSPTVIVAVITSRQTKSKIPTHFYLGDKEGLPADSIILFEQIRTIDKKRLQQYVSTLHQTMMARADKAFANETKGGLPIPEFRENSAFCPEQDKEACPITGTMFKKMDRLIPKKIKYSLKALKEKSFRAFFVYSGDAALEI